MRRNNAEAREDGLRAAGCHRGDCQCRTAYTADGTLLHCYLLPSQAHIDLGMLYDCNLEVEEVCTFASPMSLKRLVAHSAHGALLH